MGRTKVYRQALLALILIFPAASTTLSQHEPPITVAQFKALDPDEQEVYLVKLTRKWGPQLEKQRPQLKLKLHKYLFVSEDGADLVRIEKKNVQFGEVVYDVQYFLDNDILKYELETGVVSTSTGTVQVAAADIQNVSMDEILQYVVAKFPSGETSDRESELEDMAEMIRMAVPDSTPKPAVAPRKIRSEDIDKIEPFVDEPDRE